MKTTIKTDAARGSLPELGSSLSNHVVRMPNANKTFGTKGGINNTPSDPTDPPLLCFHCCMEKNMGMAIKVLQTSKILLRKNAPKAHVERGINIARAMLQDLMDLVGEEHKH
jgi:hypothetical protein